MDRKQFIKYAVELANQEYAGDIEQVINLLRANE